MQPVKSELPFLHACSRSVTHLVKEARIRGNSSIACTFLNKSVMVVCTFLILTCSTLWEPNTYWYGSIYLILMLVHVILFILPLNCANLFQLVAYFLWFDKMFNFVMQLHGLEKIHSCPLKYTYNWLRKRVIEYIALLQQCIHIPNERVSTTVASFLDCSIYV